jgi:hypothetical protein
MVSPKTVAMLSRRAVVRAQPWGCAAGQDPLVTRGHPQTDAMCHTSKVWKTCPKNTQVGGKPSPTQPSLSCPRSPVSMQWQLKQACCKGHRASLMLLAKPARQL